MSSVILFWPYLKASFNTPIKQVLGATMEFKTTLKGSGRGGIDFKVFGVPMLIVALNFVTFVIGAATLDAQINAAKGVMEDSLFLSGLFLVLYIPGQATLHAAVCLATVKTTAGISLCWIVFNTIPHLLLLLNSYFGPGVIMSMICKGCMALTSLSGMLAVVLMWLLYPREVDWLPSLDASITFMQAQMSGTLPGDHRVDWRNNSGLQYSSIAISSLGIRSNFRPCVSTISCITSSPAHSKDGAQQYMSFFYPDTYSY